MGACICSCLNIVISAHRVNATQCGMKTCEVEQLSVQTVSVCASEMVTERVGDLVSECVIE